MSCRSSDLILDPANHQVRRGEPAHRADRAANLPCWNTLIRNPNRLMTREMIETHVWNYDFVSGSNVIDVYIRRLRRKIDENHAVRLIETVRGEGYRLVSPEKDGSRIKP